MQTEQDKINSVLDNLSDEQYKVVLEELKLIPSYAGHLNWSMSLDQRAVMTKEASLKFKELFDILKLDYVNDPNLKSTPIRIASMWTNELMVGRYQEAPRIESFPADESLLHVDGDEESQDIIISKRVDVSSLCSHHFMPFFNNEENAYAIIAINQTKRTQNS